MFKKPNAKYYFGIIEMFHLQWIACSGGTGVLPFHFHREFFVLFRKYFSSSSGESNCRSACLQYSLKKCMWKGNLVKMTMVLKIAQENPNIPVRMYSPSVSLEKAKHIIPLGMNTMNFIFIPNLYTIQTIRFGECDD